MAGFWNTNKITAPHMNRLGPLVDGVVGTDGEYTDLYTAMGDPAGPQWNRVLVVPGATLNTDLAKASSSNGCILGIGSQAITGTGKITLTDTTRWIIENIILTNTACANGAINILGATSYYNIIDNCVVSNPDGQGIYVSGDRTRIIDCRIYSAADDGIEIAAGVTLTWINSPYIHNGAAWGILDNSNKAHISDGVIVGNASGQISGTNTYHSNNQVA